MLTKTYTAAVQGIDAYRVTVETLVEPGTIFSIVGLPDTAIKESHTRMSSAIKAAGLTFPHCRVIINLSPADVKKEGAGFDLPMALGILASSEQVPAAALSDCLVAGELSLDGSVLPVRGILPMAIRARQDGFKRMIVPAANATEAAVVNDVEVFGVETLKQAAELLHGIGDLKPVIVDTRREFARHSEAFDIDFADVKGQEGVKRAFEVACAGGHNILLVGPPGSGKSMMAKRLPTILPPLSLHEALETTKIHSVAGRLERGSMLMTRRPFRSPHHTVSPVALVGGGANPQPGEISLAHNGVLFLDEFPEFTRQVLEVMRQPIEDRVITVSRAKYTVQYPASFMLVASMNPCPCGYFGHPTKPCTCLPGAVTKYMNRISGPLLDRIDIQVEIQPVEFSDISSTTPSESSAEIRKRVVRAHAIQQQRFKDEPGVYCNAQMNTRLLRTYAWPDEQGMQRMRSAMERNNMSARAFDRILRVARTIADLDESESVKSTHIAEAIGYRNLDRMNATSSPF
ncbi:MAG: YifB family Mg chelatase-like AAA ATPase [Prevotella sp.]|nr:YifB family Mg chelatase-like AAA ATPase [Prevotella sp.]MCM1074484.1 YifB family Mg chelatase-like AAA ATPase [Ruminococcus sp.]